MKKVTVKIENCYGIGSLNHVFRFDDSKVYSVYAPNGFMKTSLAKSFIDLINGSASGDQINKDRVSVRDIKDQDGADLSGESVFVIQPYEQNFVSSKASLLLVNAEIKKGYDQALDSIESKKIELLKILKEASGLTGRNITSEGELVRCFGAHSLFDCLESLEERLDDVANERFAALKYANLFNDKTMGFLDSGAIKRQLNEYIEKYNELVAESPILSKTFNYYHATTVQKNLLENGFFSASHSINLNNAGVKQEVKTADELAEKIDEEKKKIFSNDDLNKKFNEIDKKLTTKELREFRDYLLENKDIVSELADYSEFQRKIWLEYLREHKVIAKEFIDQYKQAKEVIRKSIEAAKSERTLWEAVVEQFNSRFTVPFELAVVNQEDVILKGTSPQVAFKFKDSEDVTEIDQSLLIQVLSQGEKRALYILNILFELNARKNIGLKTLVVADDIADSFDYKNKYAIIEYLRELSRQGDFNCIFLTHNFDFHRTISSRLGIPRHKKLFAVKSNRNLALREELYQKDPFAYWKEHFDNAKFLIAAIPFVRNLAEYCNRPSESDDLTALLHIRPKSKRITIERLESIYQLVLNDPSISLPHHEIKVIDLIYETCDVVLSDPNETAELDGKIILSMGIRLKAEEFMISAIKDDKFVDEITGMQTYELFNAYKGKFQDSHNTLELLEKVNLMTPENIHLNSFMYEPILDMGADHLRGLYKAVLKLR